MMDTNVVACLGITGLMIIFFAFIIGMRFISYKQTLTLAEKGLLPLPPQQSRNGKNSLRWGIIIASIGVALFLGMWPFGWGHERYPLGLGPWMIAAFLPMFFGFGLILIYILADKDTVEIKPIAQQPALKEDSELPSNDKDTANGFLNASEEVEGKSNL